MRVTDVHDASFATLTDEYTYRSFIDEIELLDGAGAEFDRDAMLRGETTPVFFGSAVTNFGVELFLDAFVRMGPSPTARMAEESGERKAIEPITPSFSGFVFKIQANMDPRHRDRVAFLRVCSGRFERDMTVRNMRTGRDVRLTRAMKLFASDREVVEEAFAGDVVGLANPGTFAIGDTLCDGIMRTYDAIPSFMPERFALLRSIDTATYKSFGKGLTQLEEEGAIQIYYSYNGARAEPILAAVGQLQFEVVRSRLESEYNVKTILTALPYTVVRRVRGKREAISGATLPTNANSSKRSRAKFSCFWKASGASTLPPTGIRI